MNKRDQKKLAALAAKCANQGEAFLSYMNEGNTITSTGAICAGIADPRRVVNHLRRGGYRINAEQVESKGSRATVYALAPAAKIKGNRK